MAEILLKSRLLEARDYRGVDISRFAIPLKPDPLRYQRDVTNFRKRFAKKEEPETIAAQDMVTLSCTSGNPKFQKEHIIVRVGAGLYSKELEAKLVGLRPGEERELTVGPDTVMIRVEKVVREIIPELTDELAAQSGIPGVQTAEDADTYCRFQQYDKLLEDPADDAFAYLAGEVVSGSRFELDPNELAFAKEKLIRSLDDHRLLGGRTLDEVPEEDFIEAFGISKQDMREQLAQTGESTLKVAVLGQAIRPLQDTDYEAYLRKLAEGLERPVEEICRTHPLMDYLVETYSDFYLNQIEQYTFKKLKEVGEWMHRSGQSS